jgi:hypothetical protein
MPSRADLKREKTLAEKYPPSEPCSCEVCVEYCVRPGWWTVQEASTAMDAGYAKRMMLELSPERNFAVVSPAFRGCEGTFAFERYRTHGCTFHENDRCLLHDAGLKPLECRFCHHSRAGMEPACHADLERNWHSPAGHVVVAHWCKLTGVWYELDRYGPTKLRL